MTFQKNSRYVVRLVGVLLVMAALVVTRHYSPAFPDRDMIRYGLFVPFVSIDEALVEACNTQQGSPWVERSPCRVECLFLSGEKWVTPVAEEVCESLH